MTNFEKYSLYVSGAAALGTIILAIIAIFGGWIRRLFIKPKIDMTISKSKPYVELVRENNPNESDETKFKKIHLKIGNKGRQTAINSQLLVEKVFKKRGDNQTYYLDKSFIPCNFLWFNEKESKPVTCSISHFIEIARIQKYQEFSSDVEEEGQPVRNRDMYRLWLSIENNSEKGTYFFKSSGDTVAEKLLTNSLISEFPSNKTVYSFSALLFWISDFSHGFQHLHGFDSRFHYPVLNLYGIFHRFFQH